MRASEKRPAHDTLRTFIALELAPEIKQALTAYLQPLQKAVGGISWVKTENLHLTLKFLGDTPSAQIPEIAAVLGEICARYGTMSALLTGNGMFPNEKNPRVLWLGIEESSGKLVELAQRIEIECRRLGIQKEEKSFNPHLTIGRVKNGKAAAISNALREHPVPVQPLSFQECTLMKSALHAAGSIYTPLRKFAFQRF